ILQGDFASMSTNWEYTSVSSRDVELVSRTKQLEPTSSGDSLGNEPGVPQPDPKTSLALHKEDTTQTSFTNVDSRDVIEIPNWPGPQKLEATCGKRILNGIGYILFLVPPLIFLVLVLSAIGLHSKGASPFGKFVIQACLLGPTVFPIAFSAILGWCLKTYGRYKSERGVNLGFGSSTPCWYGGQWALRLLSVFITRHQDWTDRFMGSNQNPLYRASRFRSSGRGWSTSRDGIDLLVSNWDSNGFQNIQDGIKLYIHPQYHHVYDPVSAAKTCQYISPPPAGTSFVLETQFIPPIKYSVTVTERNVECASGNCGVTRIKKIDRPIDQFPARHSSQTELYLYNPRQLRQNASTTSVDLREVPIAEFNSSDSLAYTQNDVSHWVISALVASLAMLAIAIAGVLLETRVISPDIYGYVSSMTRDNPYFPLATDRPPRIYDGWIQNAKEAVDQLSASEDKVVFWLFMKSEFLDELKEIVTLPSIKLHR
ncbi:12546_t:CDS:10, partial [Acaulospora colombiana]